MKRFIVSRVDDEVTSIVSSADYLHIAVCMARLAPNRSFIFDSKTCEFVSFPKPKGFRS